MALFFFVILSETHCRAVVFKALLLENFNLCIKMNMLTFSGYYVGYVFAAVDP
jgi:hypothetical protein